VILSLPVDDLKKKIKAEKPGLIYVDADLLIPFHVAELSSLDTQGGNMKALKESRFQINEESACRNTCDRRRHGASPITSTAPSSELMETSVCWWSARMSRMK
jgi:hypothetical protein